MARKFTAKIAPYSSIVGGGLMLLDEQDRAAFQIVFIGTTAGITKEETDELARQFQWFVEEIGIELPDRT